MKKIEWGQLLGILANVGVIAGIVFLAFELNQNTQVARQDAYNSFAQSINELNIEMATDVGLSELIARVSEGAGRNDFTPAERIRLDMFHLANMRVFEGMYQSPDIGVIGESYLEALGTSAGYQSRYFLDYWPENRSSLTKGFVEYVESVNPSL